MQCGIVTGTWSFFVSLIVVIAYLLHICPEKRLVQIVLNICMRYIIADVNVSFIMFSPNLCKSMFKNVELATRN